jgi:hypothetical protein
MSVERRDVSTRSSMEKRTRKQMSMACVDNKQGSLIQSHTEDAGAQRQAAVQEQVLAATVGVILPTISRSIIDNRTITLAELPEPGIRPSYRCSTRNQTA